MIGLILQLGPRWNLSPAAKARDTAALPHRFATDLDVAVSMPTWLSPALAAQEVEGFQCALP